jgi:hypothetical protein
VEGWLRSDIDLRATVIHERLVAEHGFTCNYQRVKMFAIEARPRIAAELVEGDDNPLTGLQRRFEVRPGAQAQVDWPSPPSPPAGRWRAVRTSLAQVGSSSCFALPVNRVF